MLIRFPFKCFFHIAVPHLGILAVLGSEVDGVDNVSNAAIIGSQHKSKSLYALEYLRHKAVFGLDHQIWKNLSASWSVRWQQRMNGYHPYTKVDCKLMWDAKKYSIYVKADNITCHRYYDLTAVKQPGLWIMAGASVNLGW